MGDLDDCHSTSGNLFLLAGGPVSWLSKKQSTVALSTAEAEYMSLSGATQEAVWLRRLLSDFKFSQEEPTVIKEDNQGTIAIARKSVSHSRIYPTHRHQILLCTQNSSGWTRYIRIYFD